MLVSSRLRSLVVASVLVFCTTVGPALAGPPDLDGRMRGFTQTGVLIGTPTSVVEIPFAPTSHDDRASIDTQALRRGVDSEIYIPIEDKPITLESTSYNYLQPVVKDMGPQPQDKVERFFATRLKKLKRLSDRVSRIVNPHIQTKNYDIVIQPMLSLHP